MLFNGFEHVALLLGAVFSGIGIIRAVKAWREEREKAAGERLLNQNLIKEVLKEFKPNHGTSLVDRLERLSDRVRDHNRSAEEWFRDNAEEHAELHRRIDGLFELFGQSTQPRRIAEKHHQSRTEEE